MTRRRILFVGGTYGGGVATVNNEVAALFATEGYQCQQLDTEELKSRLPAALAYLFGYGSLIRNLFTFRPHTVYLQCAQTGYFHQSLFLLLAKIFGRHTVAHFHAKADLKEAVSSFQFTLIMLSRFYTDKIILLTAGCRQSLVTNGWDRPAFVVHNFVDTKTLPDYRLPFDERHDVLYLGRMDAEKGIFDVLAVARQLPSRSFLFVGNFSDERQERMFVEQLKSTPNARWLGAMYDLRKFDVLARARYLLFPTRRDEFPMTLIEASLMGCIPLVSPVGSIPEIIRDGFNGFYVRPGDVELMVDMLQNLDQRNDLQHIADNGRQYAMAHFTSDVARGQLLDIVGR